MHSIVSDAAPSTPSTDKSEKSPKGKGKGRSDSDDKKKSEKSPKGKGKGESKSPKGKGKGDRSPKGKGKGDRSPKGGKGKGKGGDYADCKIIPIFQFVAELSAGFQENAVGGGFDNVPFYSQETGQQLGFYTDSAADLDSEDCAGTGSFSFDFQEPYENQIAFQFTCFGQFNSITGGNGAFGCASGFEEFVFEDDEVIASQLYVCGSLCPFVMKLK